jgi:hypothetical protein
MTKSHFILGVGPLCAYATATPTTNRRDLMKGKLSKLSESNLPGQYNAQNEKLRESQPELRVNSTGV